MMEYEYPGIVAEVTSSNKAELLAEREARQREGTWYKKWVNGQWNFLLPLE